MKQLKRTFTKDLTILGSGNLTTQLAEGGLIDSYQIMIDPVAIGSDTSIFKNMKNQLLLKLTDTHTFKSGTVLLTYNAV